MSRSPKVAAGFVVYRVLNDTIEYLLMQTSYGEHHWTPPKGHVDPGEDDPLVTAFRETQEEAGLLKEHLKIVPDSRKELYYLVNGKPKTVIYWLATLIDPNTPIKMSEEHQDYKWLLLNDACKYGNYKDMQELLKYYDNLLKSK